MSDFDEEDLPEQEEEDEEGPDSINDIYGYDNPEDNEEAAFDDVLKAMESGD